MKTLCAKRSDSITFWLLNCFLPHGAALQSLASIVQGFSNHHSTFDYPIPIQYNNTLILKCEVLRRFRPMGTLSHLAKFFGLCSVRCYSKRWGWDQFSHHGKYRTKWDLMSTPKEEQPHPLPGSVGISFLGRTLSIRWPSCCCNDDDTENKDNETTEDDARMFTRWKGYSGNTSIPLIVSCSAAEVWIIQRQMQKKSCFSKNRAKNEQI